MQTIRRGSVGPAVAEWQRVLAISDDGVFGPATERATKAWQAEHELAADGVVGPKTWIACGLVKVDERVEVVRTAITGKDYARCLAKAWTARHGTPPTKAQLGVLWAQYMVETGATHCYNFNIGNIKEIPGDGLPYMALRGVWEILPNGKRAELDKEDPGSWFTAFPSLDVGAEWYLKKLKTNFAQSWPFVLMGDPAGFASALKRQRYYTAPERDYVAGMKVHHAAWMKATHFEDAMRELEAEAAE